jgi:serine/threonine protein phosphatase PrpC
VSARPLLAEAAGATDVGRVRTANEDRFVARPDLGVFVVADGMGGHDDGAVASGLIAGLVETIPPAPDAAGLLAAFEGRIIEANRRILDHAAEKGLSVVGSTVAALLVHSGHWACLWCGDSRVYLLREGRLARLTRDHTSVRDMVDQGLLTEEQADVFPGRSMLTRAVGVDTEVALDMEDGPAAAGDRFVLCSDGLTGHVSDREIASLVAGRSPQEAASALVELALARGGHDNVTVVVVALRSAGPVPVPAPDGPRRAPRDLWE